MCVRCHAGFNFTGEGYRNIGIGMNKPIPDLGRYEVTGDDADRGAFKTPTLRDVAKRGPYMHDGSERTLADVVTYYNQGGVKNTWLSADMKPLGLTVEEQADLVEFMKALSGEIDPEVSRPPCCRNEKDRRARRPGDAGRVLVDHRAGHRRRRAQPVSPRLLGGNGQERGGRLSAGDSGASAEGNVNKDPKQVERVRAIAARIIPQTAVFRKDAPAGSGR